MTNPKPITAWSASRLAAYERCPFAFAQENVYGNKAPKGPKAQRGIEVHADMAQVSRGVMTLAEVRHRPDHLFDFAPTVADIVNNVPMVEEEWPFTKNMGRAKSWFSPDVGYRVTLDAGVWWPDDSFTAVDWKTGKRYGSNDDQMEQYAMATFARLPQIKEVETILAYLDTGEHEREVYQREQYHALKEKWWARARPMFVDKIFAPRPNAFCKGCHFRRSNGGPCPFS